MIRQVCDEAVSIIKHYESLHDGDLKKVGLQPKLCPADIWTEGYGHAMINPLTRKPLKGKDNKELAYSLSKIKNEEDAIKFLKQDLDDFSIALSKWLNKNDLIMNDYQFGALICLIFNIGFDTFENSAVLTTLIKNKMTSAIPLQMRKFRLSKGKVLNGLICRRESEAVLFSKGKLELYEWNKNTNNLRLIK